MKTEQLLRREGMDEESIAQIYNYDKEYFNSRRRYEEHRALEIPEEVIFMEDNIEEEIHFLDTIEDVKLYQVLKKLKPEELEIIQLHIIEELTVTEISKMYGKSKSTISEKIHRILKKMKKLY